MFRFSPIYFSQIAAITTLFVLVIHCDNRPGPCQNGDKLQEIFYNISPQPVALSTQPQSDAAPGPTIQRGDKVTVVAKAKSVAGRHFWCLATTQGDGGWLPQKKAQLLLTSIAIPPQPLASAYSTAKSGLILRGGPNQKGKRLGKLPFGSKVEVFVRQTKTETIAGKESSWQFVTWSTTKGKRQLYKGWVFGGFLTPKFPFTKNADLPYPITTTKAKALQCCQAGNESTKCSLPDLIRNGYTPTVSEWQSDKDLQQLSGGVPAWNYYPQICK